MEPIQITIPHQFTPRAYQLPFLKAFDSGLINRGVLVWHRRAGKDKTVLQMVIKKMLERVGTYWYIFPTYNLGKKALWDGIDGEGFKLMDHFPDEIVVTRNEQEMRIELFNGSAFQIVGGDTLQSNVGANPVGVVYSEYPVGKESAWNYIRPILAENGGWAIFTYTPRGMNHGWKLLQQAKNEPGWFWQVLTAEDTGVIDKATLESEKRQMPEDLYYQEYFCKFLEGAGRYFRNIDRCIYDDKLEQEPSRRFAINPGRRFRIGVDLGKYQDFTVITPIDLTTFKVGQPVKFNQMDYSLQKARIETEYLRYNKGLIRIDSTHGSVGDPILNDLQKQGLAVEGFGFTQNTRTALLENLRLLLENETIKIPNDTDLIDELRSFQYELGEQGKIKIVVPDGLHDDMVMSLALACWELPTQKQVNPQESGKALLKEFDFYKEKSKNLSGSAYLRKRYK